MRIDEMRHVLNDADGRDYYVIATYSAEEAVRVAHRVIISWRDELTDDDGGMEDNIEE